VSQAIAKLQKRFPQTFPRNPAPKVPLKIGIFEDLVPHAQEVGLTEPVLRNTTRTWCRGTRYWTGLVEDAPRVDLAGQAAEHVALADAKRAQGLQAQRAARVISTLDRVETRLIGVDRRLVGADVDQGLLTLPILFLYTTRVPARFRSDRIASFYGHRRIRQGRLGDVVWSGPRWRSLTTGAVKAPPHSSLARADSPSRVLSACFGSDKRTLPDGQDARTRTRPKR
jgi:hypothetical protein